MENKDDILKEITKLGFYLSGGETRLIYDDKKRKERVVVYTFDFSIARLNYCCGVEELGGFNLYAHSHHKSAKASRAIELFLKYRMLDKHYDVEDVKRLARTKKKPPKVVPFLITTINTAPFKVLENVLDSLKDHFALVSETINPGTKNRVRIYISKH